MDANKRFVCVALLFFLSLCGFSQTVEKSFLFDKAPLPEVVQTVVESFGLYLSYDPYIFKNSSPVSLQLKFSSVQEALEYIVSDDFSFQILNEYVIIKKKKKDMPEPDLPSSNLEKRIFYDTIIVRKTETFYDTVEVESVKNIEVYDTTHIQKEIMVYDTIDYVIEKEESRKKLLFYLGPSIWRRDGDNMNGALLGFSYRHHWKHFYLEASLSYQYYLQNISFSQTDNLVDLKIDTISTFFIIENEERVPVFVIDSTFNEREVVREVDRTNSYHLLTLAVLVGKAFTVSERVDVGVNFGVSMDWVFQASEILEPDETSDETPIELSDYRVPLHNVRLEVPFTYKSKSQQAEYYLAPFSDLGLNSDFQNSTISSERYRFGVKLGVVF